jgi:signal transduction histidine kinase
MIFQNLIINAAEAMPTPPRTRGVLRVSATPATTDSGAAAVQLVFADNGNGLSESQLQRVFERGFSTKSGATNSGIGLHWCANALLALGGQISMDSDGPGKGARVILVVPIASADNTAVTQAA